VDDLVTCPDTVSGTSTRFRGDWYRDGYRVDIGVERYDDKQNHQSISLLFRSSEQPEVVTNDGYLPIPSDIYFLVPRFLDVQELIEELDLRFGFPAFPGRPSRRVKPRVRPAGRGRWNVAIVTRRIKSAYRRA